MVELLRHLLAVAILPFTVTVVVPVWIAKRYAIAPALGGSTGQVGLQLVGLGLCAIGLLLFLASLRRFVSGLSQACPAVPATPTSVASGRAVAGGRLTDRQASMTLEAATRAAQSTKGRSIDDRPHTL